MTDILKLLVEVTLFSSAMILVVLSIKAVLGKRIGIRLISVLWMLVLVRLILPITFESPVHLVNAAQENVSEEVTQDSPANQYQVQNNHNQNILNNPQTVHVTDESLTAQTEAVSTKPESISSKTIYQQIWTFLKAVSIWTYAFSVWVIGAVVLLTRHMVQMIKFNSRVRNCVQKDSEELDSLLEQNKIALGIEKSIRIIECSSVDMPVTLGIIKPKILIPKGYVRLIDHTQLSLMIMHELCHIRRNDIFKNYLWLFAKIVHWFNPLVLFAFKSYRDDIEIACDEMVLQHVSEESKFEYSQGLLEAIKLSRNEIKTPAALSFCKDKTKLRERVETMIKPKKRSRTAAATAVLISVVMVLACFTTACQPTPDEPIIAQKDALEKSIESMKQQDNSETPLEPVIQEQKFTVPTTWQDEITQSSTGNKVFIEADVICPEFDSIDVVNIVPKNFTQQEVDELIAYFVGCTTLYNGEYQETKEKLKERIIETQRIMAMTQEQRDAECGGYTKEELQQELEDLQARYEDAPDNEIQTAVTSELTTDKDGCETLDTYADFGGSDDILIEVYNLVEECNSASFYIRLRDQSGDGEIRDFDGEPEEVAQAVLNDLGVKDAQLRVATKAAASKDPDNKKMNIRLFYERTIAGIPIRAVCHLIGQNEREYAAPNWHPEKISFDVSENGLTCFAWSGHGEIGEIVVKDVALMPFEDVMKEFESNIFLQPFWGPYEEGKETQESSYHITSITLCMVPIAKKDESGESLLVPAWNFYGCQDLPEGMEEFLALNIGESRESCLMTLSAIDGTLLHR